MIDSAGIRMSQGSPIACERIEGVNDNMSQSHYHDYYELYYLETGERYHIIRDELYLIHGGQFVLFAPYVMHHSYGDQDIAFRRIVLYFKPTEICSEELLKALSEDSGVYRTDTRSRYSVHQLLKMLLDAQDDSKPYHNEYMNTLLNLLLLAIERQFSKPEPHEKQTRIGQVIDYIHKHYDEKITLESLSRDFFVSPYYLCREFKRFTNRTIIQYINVTRIMNAQRKIMETPKSITEIANITGFSNVTHFNRVFKSITGMSPSAYKKTISQEKRHSSL